MLGAVRGSERWMDGWMDMQWGESDGASDGGINLEWMGPRILHSKASTIAKKRYC